MVATERGSPMSQGSEGRVVVPVILSGGTGTRLWPLSRELYPKQLLPLLSEVSLLQQTAWRVRGAGFAPPMVVCSAEHRFVIAEQLRSLGIQPSAIVLEPSPRDTAPALAAAAELVAARDPEALMLVLPSDHAVEDPEAFREAVASAATVAGAGHLVTFGMAPRSAETGFGYIKQGKALPDLPGFGIERFVEKPDAQSAKRFVSSGHWWWNSGMFVFPPRLFLEELSGLEPLLAKHVADSVSRARPDLDFLRLEEGSFTAAPAISVDHAVMEHTKRAAVVPADFGWSDVGSWSALWEMGERDESQNVILGDVITDDAAGCYLRSDGPLVAALGLRDTVVVATTDAVLVADRGRDQQVKAIVQRLKKQGRDEAITHRLVYRPWGSYEGIDAGPGYQVKHITVKPGHQLSLQRHAHRSEHWVVISGVAEVTRGKQVLTLREQMSCDVPVGVDHRLANPGPEMLHLIEVQTGGYLGEDDIVRLDDVYGRGAEPARPPASAKKSRVSRGRSRRSRPRS